MFKITLDKKYHHMTFQHLKGISLVAMSMHSYSAFEGWALGDLVQIHVIMKMLIKIHAGQVVSSLTNLKHWSVLCMTY